MPYPNGITLDSDFTTSIPSGWTFNRASSATDGFYTDAPGSSYNSFTNDQPRFNANGCICEVQARTNYFLNSTAPANHTTGSSMPVGLAVLWMIGTGSVTIAAGTGVASAYGTATQGNPFYFSVTTAGNFAITVSGSVNRAQLESGCAPTSFIVTAGTIVTRAVETCFQSGGSWLNGAAGTILMEFAAPVLNANTTGVGLIGLDDGTTSNIIRMTQNADLRYLTTVGGTARTNVAVAGVTVAAGTVYRMAVRYNQSITETRSAGAGVLTNSITTQPVPTPTRVAWEVGTAANRGITYWLRRVQYWPFAMVDADLQNATLTPPIAAVTASGRGSAPAGRSALSALNVQPSARGRGGAAQAGATRSLIPPTFAVVFARGRGGYAAARSISPTLLANVQAVGRPGSAKARSARSRALSSVAAAGAAKPKSPAARATFPQSVGARGKALAKSRAFGAGTFSFSARGKVASPKGRITKFSPAAAGHAGRAKGRIRATMTAGSRGRAAARLRGAIGPVIPPPAVLSFWQKLGVVTPQHQLQEKTRVIPNKFGDGYQQTVPDGLTPIDRTLTLTWNPLERGDVDEMLLFFRTYAGIPLTFVAPRDTGPRHWLAISWQRTSPHPHADGVTVEFQERLYVERSLFLHIAGSGDLV